jgi:hypothetical protein
MLRVFTPVGVNEGMKNPIGDKVHPRGPTNVVKTGLRRLTRIRICCRTVGTYLCSHRKPGLFLYTYQIEPLHMFLSSVVDQSSDLFPAFSPHAVKIGVQIR